MSTQSLIRFAIILGGVTNALAGAIILIAPEWFYANLADFAPYNRHFLGDAGAFSLAMGIGLLLIARAPAQHRGVIGVVALGNALHVANHLYDDLFIERGATTHWLTNTLPLLLTTLLLIWAFIAVKENRPIIKRTA